MIPTPTDPNTFQMKTVAWNGISLALPACWQPMAVNATRLLFEDHFQPVFEISWGRPAVRRNALKRIHRRLNRIAADNKCSVMADPLPIKWRRALARFEFNGFRWRSAKIAAIGMVIYCPICGMTTLMQFFHPLTLTESCHDSIEAILAAFRDHDQKNKTFWALYDIQAKMPFEFQLVKHHFRTGLFQLDFKGKFARVTLYRFAPADVILKGQSLEEFACKGWPAKKKRFADAYLPRECNMIYETVPTSSFFRQAAARCYGRKLGAWVNIRQLMPVNRILAVRAEGDRRNIQATLADIVDHYSHAQS